MLVSPAPIAMPVNTANIQTEAIRAEAIQRPQIPQPTQAADSARAKDSKEFADQNPNSNAQGIDEEKYSRIDPEQADEQNKGKDDSDSESRSQGQAVESNSKELSQQEIEQVAKLRSRDREVKAHEQAHASTGGSLAGAPSLDYTTGPDGKRYATSGEVSIDTSPVAGDPQATIQKLQQVQRAALAPANPSSQDRKVASQASSLINQAQLEISLEAVDSSQAAANNAKASPQTNAENENPNTQLNPIYARRQAAQLNQKIATSGALESNPSGSNIALRV